MANDILERSAPAEASAPGAAVSGLKPPPAILLGGTANAISVARSLARIGVDVYALNRPRAHVRYSRYAQYIETPGEGAPGARWLKYLLGPESDHLRGAVVFSCSDDGIEIETEHRDALLEKFRLDICPADIRRAMLDKLKSYRICREIDVPVPKFWEATTVADVDQVRDELVYPLLIKPHFSHHFVRVFGRKFFLASNFDEAVACFRKVEQHEIATVLLEVIPGADDTVCSYYSWLDESGEPQFDFTKTVLRRNPPNEGMATYHVSRRFPDAIEMGRRFFERAGLRGFGCVEFKRDARDGQLKLIECNARFTAAIEVVTAAGYDLPRFVYERVTGRPTQPFGDFREETRLWFPWEDLGAFRRLRARGDLSLGGWLKSILRPASLPYWSWRDPWPTMVTEARRLVSMPGKILKKLFGR